MSVGSPTTNAPASSAWPQGIPELQPIALAKSLRIPLGRAAAEADVKPAGTVVSRGQPIVFSASESSHLPLAPADGTIGNLRPIRLTNGTSSTAVEFTVSSPEAEETRVEKPGLSGSILVELLETIRAAGVWADRTASPDLIGQLNQIVARPIDTLICTILDTDAALRIGALLAFRFADALAEGVSLLTGATGARRAIIAVEAGSDPHWLKPLSRACRKFGSEIIEMDNDYPQPDPTLMLYTLTDRRLRPGHLPTTCGVLVLDAAAALAVGKAARGEPMLCVPLAVHDLVRQTSHFFEVPVGTSIAHVMEHLGISCDQSTIRGGDLLRDLQLRPDSVVGGTELTIHVSGVECATIPDPCIRCGWCLEACPTRVQPALVLDAVQRNDVKMAERAGVTACIECGVCAHVCPSGLPLLKAIRQLRSAKIQ